MLTNKVRVAKDHTPKTVLVREASGGSLVKHDGDYYVVVLYAGNSARIGAISLHDGGHLTLDAKVELVSEGTVLEIITGGEQQWRSMI